ncbi:MAG TPA: hypothetical protein VH682_32760 [Gemmataceae bacterium]|jgi:hypothetical protein
MPARNAQEAGMDFSGDHFGPHDMTIHKLKEIEEIGQGHFSSNRPRSTTAEHEEEARKIREQLAYRWNEREADKPQRI